ncbi:DNA-binding transcriptional regulator, MarR family [Bradyrhizobium sp. Rc3b]|uniref:MarR family winged helix-turn-helix transcriptional regulator n=1 Tax=unclassified Bradyrhizobium TaxID=2631580 RepID=UPI0008E2DC6E|nr:MULTISPECIES: MarR family transcriptional regulator [unclassified Bradyrhizobium]MBB4378250.1 DNA-binding MarR family transcriptional regulator [Bradyrhizobium sp. SBR1B]SFN14914.1 DNA-binding transcriptional regulator, MarR family [Bradyrhizobium sp. Rc3b]
MSRKTDAVTRSKTRPVPEPAGDAAVRIPAPGEGKRGEQGYLGYLLRQAHAAVRLTTERTLADLGVTSPQFAVLTMLNAYPGLSGADVARLTFLTPQTVGVIIRNLERDGAILMTPHPVHGRIKQWTLTKRGTTLLKACRERVMALEKRLAGGLDAKAEASIRRWLANVATELQGD